MLLPTVGDRTSALKGGEILGLQNSDSDKSRESTNQSPESSRSDDAPGKRPGDSVADSLELLFDARTNLVLRDLDEEDTPVTAPPEDAPTDDSQFTIIGEIARGGMGVVYKARDKNLNRNVALKVLRGARADQQGVMQRFIEEAQVGGQLQHPGIVPIYGMGIHDDGRAYFAMKLVNGITLSSLLKANPHGVNPISVFEQVAQTMAYAHSRSVIHRDLKPDNVMVGAFGEVLVLDWGFAKVLGHDETLPTESTISTVRSDGDGSQSLAGDIMGTPAYMPPEQALGRVDDLDPRSDVFALGAMLTEILTGAPAYTGSARDQIIAASQGRLEGAHNRLSGCDAPAALVALARDCLRLDPDDRPADAAAVGQRLHDHFAAVEERIRASEIERIEATARAEESRLARRRTVSLAAAAAVVLLALAGGRFWWTSARDERLATAEVRVAAALDEAAEAERESNWVDAVSDAQKALSIALAAGSNATAAQDALARLEARRDAAETRARIARENDALLQILDELWAGSPDNATPEEMAAAFLAVFASLGPLEGNIDRFRTSPDSVRFAAHLDYWKSLPGAPAELLDRVARAIDPAHNELRDALAARDRARIFELADADLPSSTLMAVADRLLEYGDEALDLLWRAQRRYPDDFHIQMKLGRLTKGKQAIACFTAATALRPDSILARHALGNLYAGQKRYLAATRVWNDALRLDPEWARGMALIAGVDARHRGDLERAEELLDRAEDLDPDDWVVHDVRAFLHNANGDTAAAAESLTRVVDGHPYKPSWLKLRQQLRPEMKENELLDHLMELAQRNPDRARASRTLARTIFYDGEYERTQELLDDSLALNPDNSFAQTLQGQLFFQQKRYDEAVDAFRKGARYNSQVYTFNDRRQAYALCRAGRFDEAKEVADRLVRIHGEKAADVETIDRWVRLADTDEPRGTWEKILLAQVCYYRGQPHRALALFREADHADFGFAQYDAVCAAVLAGDAVQGLVWLRELLERLKQREAKRSGSAPTIAFELRKWQIDPDLDSTANLPGWREFWDEVAALCGNR